MGEKMKQLRGKKPQVGFKPAQGKQEPTPRPPALPHNRQNDHK